MRSLIVILLCIPACGCTSKVEKVCAAREKLEKYPKEECLEELPEVQSKLPEDFNHFANCVFKAEEKKDLVKCNQNLLGAMFKNSELFERK